MIYKYWKNLSVFLTVVLLINICSNACVSLSAKRVKAKSKCKVIAHRGYTEYGNPENTVEAFEDSVKRGFDGVELDIYRSKVDGKLYVFHDATTARMCGGKKTYIWKSKNKVIYGDFISKEEAEDGKTWYIPTFDEVVKSLRKKNKKCTIFVHMKNDKKHGYQVTYPILKEAVKTLKKYDMAKNAIIFSSAKSTFLKISKVVKKYKCATPGYFPQKITSKNLLSNMTLCRNHKAYMLVYDVEQYGTLSHAKTIISWMHRIGIKTGVYSVCSRDEYRFLKKAGADFSISNTYFAH